MVNLPPDTASEDFFIAEWVLAPAHVHSPPHYAATQTRVPLVHLDAARYSLQRAVRVSAGGLVEDEGSVKFGRERTKRMRARSGDSSSDVACVPSPAVSEYIPYGLGQPAREIPHRLTDTEMQRWPSPLGYGMCQAIVGCAPSPVSSG